MTKIKKEGGKHPEKQNPLQNTLTGWYVTEKHQGHVVFQSCEDIFKYSGKLSWRELGVDDKVNSQGCSLGWSHTLCVCAHQHDVLKTGTEDGQVLRR